jgi:hypothetical protein
VSENVELARLVNRGVNEVMAAYPDNGPVYEAVQRVNVVAGSKGVCGLCVGLVQEATPAWALDAGAAGHIVFPVNMTEPGDEYHEAANSVMRFIAAVVADDMDMAITVFKAVLNQETSEKFGEFIHVLIATTCGSVEVS